VADSNDPFTTVYTTLLAAASSTHLSVLRAANKISLVQWGDPLVKDRQASHLPAEFPDLMLRPGTGGVAMLGATSSSTVVEKVFGWRLRFGENRRVDQVYYPVQWALLCALAELYDAKGPTLGLPYVSEWTTQFNDAGNEDENLLLQGVAGWQVVSDVRVRFTFNTRELARGVF
jgi:hypothetical protein